jgi:tRNA-uridine 2-sulfurtransferase
MTDMREKVVVAMSGGVDSSVAACLLVEQGYDVIGLFMRHGVKHASENLPEPQASACATPRTPVLLPNPEAESLQNNSDPLSTGTHTRSHQGCCSASDASDARYVAGMLGIPFYALNFEDEFDELMDYFADEYARGRTPNPCVVCNDRLKFGRIVEYADAVGASHIATGHYARVEARGHRKVMLRAIDERKDQSYVLFGLSREVLDRVIFPIGGLTKAQVREIASRCNLPNRDKPDSVEICFVPDRDYARVVRDRRPDAFAEGDVVDTTGRVIGRHQGVAQYTIGQRRGLGIAAGRPIYVTGLNVESNTVVMGEDDDLKSDMLFADRVNYLLETGDWKPETGTSRPELDDRKLETEFPNSETESLRLGTQSPEPQDLPLTRSVKGLACATPTQNQLRASGSGLSVDNTHQTLPNPVRPEPRNSEGIKRLSQNRAATVRERENSASRTGVETPPKLLVERSAPGSFRAQVKIRYLHAPAPATVYPLPDRRVRVEFDEPQRAITPGQAVVFYDGDLVIGGGWIESASSNSRSHECMPPTSKGR